MLLLRRQGLIATATIRRGPSLISRVQPLRFYATPTPPRPVRPVRSKPNPEPKENDNAKSGPKDEKKASGLRRTNILIILGTLAAVTTLVRKYFGSERLPEASIDSVIMPGSSTKPRAFSSSDVSVIFVLGGPGSGKGTQCARLVKDYGFEHLSAGDLLRAEQARSGSKYGQLIADYIKAGDIVPQEITLALLEQAMRSSKSTKFLIDGFPRKMDQALTFENDIAESKLTLFLDCPESVMEKRLLNRGLTSGRSDDNIESIKKRFKTFVDTSMPVVEMFEKQGKVVRVPCDQPVDAVYNVIQNALKERGI